MICFDITPEERAGLMHQLEEIVGTWEMNGTHDGKFRLIFQDKDMASLIKLAIEDWGRFDRRCFRS